jgi:16S rRNA A1518/A1519 N6-dimethyltransferase RsmA/KsgA/DIM1 with predicted DNA glycosylase/AP lyase activity
MTLSLAPYVPTQRDVVKRMLEIACIGMEDVVFDLGCGDGRILLSAVQDFGAQQAVGYEMREDLYTGVVAKIKNEHLESRVTVFHDDLFNADLSEATVITLYLTTSGNSKLKPKLSQEAKAGTRIVSHSFRIEGWSHTQRESFHGHTIYLYTIPDSPKRNGL